MSGEARPCEAMVEHDKALCDRCLTFGIGVPLGDGRLLTPTNSCRGRLDPGRIVKFDDRYRLPSGDKPRRGSISAPHGLRKNAAARRRSYTRAPRARWRCHV